MIFSWQRLCWLLILIVFAGQAFGMNYYLFYGVSQFLLPIAIVDVLIFIHMMVNPESRLAALKGTIQWAAFCWIHSIRLLILYSWSDSCYLQKSHRFIFLSMMGAPILYALLSFRASRQLYEYTLKGLALTTLLHDEMMLHVVLDILDITSAFETAHLRCATNDITSTIAGSQLCIQITGFVIFAGFFLHANSFAGEVSSSEILLNSSNYDKRSSLDQDMDYMHNLLLEKTRGVQNDGNIVGGDEDGGERNSSYDFMNSYTEKNDAVKRTSRADSKEEEGSLQEKEVPVTKPRDENEVVYKALYGEKTSSIINNETEKWSKGLVEDDAEYLSDTLRGKPDGDEGGGSDAFYTGEIGGVLSARKSSAITSIFIVDIPLLLLRLYIWFERMRITPNDETNRLPYFTVKNLIFIALQVFRLHQAYLAQKMSASNRKAIASTKKLETAIELQCELFDAVRVKEFHDTIDSSTARYSSGNAKVRRRVVPQSSVDKASIKHGNHSPRMSNSSVHGKGVQAQGLKASDIVVPIVNANANASALDSKSASAYPNVATSLDGKPETSEIHNDIVQSQEGTGDAPNETLAIQKQFVDSVRSWGYEKTDVALQYPTVSTRSRIWNYICFWRHKEVIPVFDIRRILTQAVPAVSPAMIYSQILYLPSLPQPPSQFILNLFEKNTQPAPNKIVVQTENTALLQSDTSATDLQGKLGEEKPTTASAMQDQSFNVTSTPVTLPPLLPIYQTLRSAKENATASPVLPVRTFPAFMMMRRFWRAVRGFGRSSLLEYLPSRLKLSSLQVASIVFPMVFIWLCQIYLFWFHSAPSRVSWAPDRLAWSSLREEEQVILYLSAVYAFIMMCCWWNWTGVADLLVSVIFNFLRFISQWFVFIQIRDNTRILDAIATANLYINVFDPSTDTTTISDAASRSRQELLIKFAIVFPFIKIVLLLAPLFPSLVGQFSSKTSVLGTYDMREGIRNFSASYKLATKVSPFNFLISKAGTGSKQYSDNTEDTNRAKTNSSHTADGQRKTKVNYEYDFSVSVSNHACILFIAARNFMCPSRISTLLISSNLLKSMRVMETLTSSGWNLFCSGITLRFILLAFRFDSIQFAIFVLQFLFCIIMHISSQTNRLLAFRNQELKNFFGDAALRQVEEVEKTFEAARRLEEFSNWAKSLKTFSTNFMDETTVKAKESHLEGTSTVRIADPPRTTLDSEDSVHPITAADLATVREAAHVLNKIFACPLSTAWLYGGAGLSSSIPMRLIDGLPMSEGEFDGVFLAKNKKEAKKDIRWRSHLCNSIVPPCL